MKRVQDVIKPNVHNQSSGEAPWVLPAPAKKYAASNACKPHVKNSVVTRNTVNIPLPKRDPAAGRIENTLSKPCTHHRTLQKIFEKIKLIHFLLVGALNF